MAKHKLWMVGIVGKAAIYKHKDGIKKTTLSVR